jgi:hypothetical protein
VLDAVAALPDAARGRALRRIEDVLADDALGWRRLRRDGAVPPEVSAALLPALEALAARLPEALAGDSVTHLDLRLAPTARPTPSLRDAAGPRRAAGPTP